MALGNTVPVNPALHPIRTFSSSNPNFPASVGGKNEDGTEIWWNQLTNTIEWHHWQSHPGPMESAERFFVFINCDPFIAGIGHGNPGKGNATPMSALSGWVFV